MEVGRMARQDGGPPPGANAQIAPDQEAGDTDDTCQCKSAGPAHAQFHSIAALHAFLANIGSKGSPAAVVVKGSAGDAGGLEEAFCPVVGVEAEGAGVAADNAFGEDAAGKQPESLLLQGHEVALADFCNCRDVFQRDAASEPLHAQVFTKFAHSQPKSGNVP